MFKSNFDGHFSFLKIINSVNYLCKEKKNTLLKQIFKKKKKKKKKKISMTFPENLLVKKYPTLNNLNSIIYFKNRCTAILRNVFNLK